MANAKDYQFAHLLISAKRRITYCKYISEYPIKNGMRDYSNNDYDIADSFYKKICNSCFSDALMVISTLLDKNKRHNKSISFFNHKGLFDKKLKELEVINKEFVDFGFKKVRDEVLGHVDLDNTNNRFPYMRDRSIINNKLINKLDKIIDDLTSLFLEFNKENATPWAESSFYQPDAFNEIENIMKSVHPKMTNDIII